MPIPRDFRQTFRAFENNLDAFLLADPGAFDAHLFRAIRSAPENTTGLVDEVGVMEASERLIQYQDPEPVRAYEIPFDFPVNIETAGDKGIDHSEEPRAMLMNARKVPKGSVLVYDEYENDGTVVRRMFYIASQQSVSRHPGAAVIFFMLPFLDYDERFAQ